MLPLYYSGSFITPLGSKDPRAIFPHPLLINHVHAHGLFRIVQVPLGRRKKKKKKDEPHMIWVLYRFSRDAFIVP